MVSCRNLVACLYSAVGTMQEDLVTAEPFIP